LYWLIALSAAEVWQITSRFIIVAAFVVLYFVVMAIVMEVMEKGAMLVIASLVESRMWSKKCRP
tara:strand:+ start:496 stop:687 length:192 start_codon:yes stop_codon:yes gene_type:complete